jgi:hypothetical protein
VAIRAIAGSAGMLNLRGVDQLGFIVMAGYAQSLDIGLRENDFPVFCRSVADLALLIGERGMRELGHQFGSRGLMRIVAADAVRSFEGLVLVRLLQVSTLHIMAVDAESRRSFGQVIIKLRFPHLAGLMRGVASVAAHIEGGMAAPFLGNIQAGVVAAQAEVFFLISNLGLQQLKFVVRLVRIVALDAIAHGWRMNRTFYVVGILVCMAGQTESVR